MLSILQNLVQLESSYDMYMKDRYYCEKIHVSRMFGDN